MKNFINQLSKAGLNAFFFCLIGMVLLAWLFPQYGSKHSILHLDDITFYGVSVIFFFYGLKLSPLKLKAGLLKWKLHIIIQITTFIIFPLTALLILQLYGNTYNALWLGFFYLAVLPSTVSSSVVMVSIAGGNIPAAIFNASISSIIGIFITPLWMSLYLDKTGNTVDLTYVIIKLCLQVLVPVISGLLLHNKFGASAEKHKTLLRNFDQFIILLIVYNAFSESFIGKMFEGFKATEIILLMFSMLVFFLVMAILMYCISLLLKFSLPDRITILFCGSKKSLVQGTVFGKVIFANNATLGIILLPLMLYHALQLLAGSTIAQFLANNVKRDDVPTVTVDKL